MPSQASGALAVATPARPRIASITYTAPAPVRPGGLISVEMTGTPRAAATVEVAGLVSPTAMTEATPGNYRAIIKVPAGKQVRNAAVIGRLTVGGSKSIPVQASRLIRSAVPSRSHLPTGPRDRGASSCCRDSSGARD